MAKPKEARNKLFIEDWKKGLNDQRLAEKYNLTIGGVKGLKARLRVKDSSLYTGKKPKPLTKIEKEVAQVSGGLVKFAGKQVDKSTSPLVHTRATYYLTPEQIKQIKLIALNRNKDSSAIVREALSEWISQQVDK